jgi:hypothetical protein
MSNENRKINETKCTVCRTRPAANFWKYYDGSPVCSKLCAVQGGFEPRPVRKISARQFEPRAPGYKKPPSDSEGLAGAI